MDHVECVDCGLKVLGHASDLTEPSPVGRDRCPACGATEFVRPGEE